MVHADAFAGLSALTQLDLSSNMIKRMEFSSYPKKLQFLDLSANMIDLMPTVGTVTDAAKLQYLYDIALPLVLCSTSGPHPMV